MTRRALFAALASLPFVGRFTKKSAPRLTWFTHSHTGARYAFLPDGTRLTAPTLAFAELGGPVQTFTTPWFRTDTYHHAAGKRVVVHFMKSRTTGQWYEFMRGTRQL